jgi:hypothetical protein
MKNHVPFSRGAKRFKCSKINNTLSHFGKALFLFAIVFCSCDPTRRLMVLPVASTAHYGTYIVHRTQGVPCGGTSPFEQSFVARENALMPHAGFKSDWNPGQDPVPCQTIQAFVSKGVFNFDLTEFLATRRLDDIVSAHIQINRFTPVGGAIHVRVTQPWGGDNYFIPREPNLTHAQFVLKAVTQLWDPMAVLTGTRNTALATTPLRVQNSSDNEFRTGSSQRFDVTHEIRQINAPPSAGDRSIFGFVIEPKTVQTAYMSTNYAYGAFDAQLLLAYRVR